MDDLIEALRARYPDMGEVEAKTLAPLFGLMPDDIDALTEGRCSLADLAPELKIARAAYAAGVRDERARCAEIAQMEEILSRQERVRVLRPAPRKAVTHEH